MTTCHHQMTMERETRLGALCSCCERCGAECSGVAVGDDGLCYDPACPLHVRAGEVAPLTRCELYLYAYAQGAVDAERGYTVARVEDAQAAATDAITEGAGLGWLLIDPVHRSLSRCPRLVREMFERYTASLAHHVAEARAAEEAS